MKIEIDDTKLIENIAGKVIEHIKPLLNEDNGSKDNKLMTVDEVAAYLRVKKSYIYEKIHVNGIPYHKVGKFLRFRKNEIDIWIRNPYASTLAKSCNLGRKEVLEKEATSK